MLIEITINCEDEKELLSHLSAIRRNLNRAIKKHGGEFKTPHTIEEKNCYGDHTVNIIPECTQETGHFPDGSGFCLSCSSQLYP